jgi:hypothetical protein
MFDNFDKKLTTLNILIIFLFITSIILGIMAFIPYKKDLSCEDSGCDGAFFPPGAVCKIGNDNKKKCFINKHRYYLIIPSVVLFGISCLLFYGNFNDIYNDKSKNLED